MRKTLLYLLVFGLFTSCVVIDEMNEESGPLMVDFTVKVNSLQALKSCEGDGNSGEADIFTKITLHKNEEPGGSSWAVLAEQDWKEVELAKSEIAINPGIEVSEAIEVFDGMRVEAIITMKEVDPNSTQIQKQYYVLLNFDEAQNCWVPEGGGDCVDGSDSGSYYKQTESRMSQGNCDIILNWEASLQII